MGCADVREACNVAPHLRLPLRYTFTFGAAVRLRLCVFRCLHPNLQQLLRNQLGFQGYIISDEGAITFAGPDYHGYTPNVTLAACLAMDAGTGLCGIASLTT